MANKQMTYVEAIAIALEVVENDEAKARLEALSKKLSEKKSSKKTDNSAYYEPILEALAEGPLTPTELMSKTGMANTQKVASVVKELGDKITKTTKGKKVTYTLA